MRLASVRFVTSGNDDLYANLQIPKHDIADAGSTSLRPIKALSISVTNDCEIMINQDWIEVTAEHGLSLEGGMKITNLVCRQPNIGIYIVAGY